MNQQLVQSQNQQSSALMIITQGIADLRMEQSSRPVITISTECLDKSHHTVGLQAEIDRMAMTIEDPVLRSGFQMGMRKALREQMETVPSNSELSSYCESLAASQTDTAERNPDVFDIDLINRRPKKRSRRMSLLGRRSSKTQNLFGTIYFTSETYHVWSDHFKSPEEAPSICQYESRTSFIFHPAQWLIKCGLRFGLDFALTRSIRGWKNNLNSFRAVPDDALIFELCREGIIDGVRSVLARGEASPRDRDSCGWTPLHVSKIPNTRQNVGGFPKGDIKSFSLEPLPDSVACLRSDVLFVRCFDAAGLDAANSLVKYIGEAANSWMKVAARHGEVELCNLLLDAGADKTALTFPIGKYRGERPR